MIHDIRLQECEFIKAPYIPLNSARGFHLFYILEGDGTLIIGSSSYPCHKDNLLLFPSVEIAIPQPGKRSALTIFHVAFSANSPNLLLELRNLPCRFQSETRFRNLLMEIVHEFTLKPEGYIDMCSFYLEQLLFPYIMKRKREKENFPSHTFITPDNPALVSVCEYIERNLTGDLSTRRLCSIACMNTRQLNRLFKDFCQLSMVEYVGIRRLAKAKELLLFSRDSITQIAEGCGFKSVHYFSAFFKRREGVTASEYRRQVGLFID